MFPAEREAGAAEDGKVVVAGSGPSAGESGKEGVPRGLAAQGLSPLL